MRLIPVVCCELWEKTNLQLFQLEAKMIQTATLCFFLVIPTCIARHDFVKKIPNGDKVFHPCKKNQNWLGVGHENPNGGGDRNVFGKAFQKQNFKWTNELCQEDTDGDGRSNGVELGDPDCVWSEGNEPANKVNITHPGICEPLDSSICAGKNVFVSCELDSFEKCTVIKKEGILTTNLTFNKYHVPASVTTYVCMTYELPNDQDYHIVANQAIIDNADVLHHMLLYGCEGDSPMQESPTPCSMFDSSCKTIMGAWTVGQIGECYGESLGFRFGKGDYKRVRLQIHYNNPGMKTTYADSSGLRLYYRPVRSDVQDLATLTIGQIKLDLPAGQSRIEEVGVCNGDCTKQLITEKQSVSVFSALNHMHYLGRSMRIELKRKGVVIANLTNDDHYSYDSPVTHYHNPTIKIIPGDELSTKCVYDTSSSKDTVYFGDATADEMCFGFILVYPKSVVEHTHCVAQSNMSSCQIKGCELGSFLHYNGQLQRMASDLKVNCNHSGCCSTECKDLVNELSKHECIQGDMRDYVKRQMARTKEGSGILEILQSCQEEQSSKCPESSKGGESDEEQSTKSPESSKGGESDEEQSTKSQESSKGGESDEEQSTKCQESSKGGESDEEQSTKSPESSKGGARDNHQMYEIILVSLVVMIVRQLFVEI
ncbi:Tyramine beta-hydroxylase [Bulinus truncatus]|nr:Tyramine beta-hydroxylase [Bulinus truncatus]